MYNVIVSLLSIPVGKLDATGGMEVAMMAHQQHVNKLIMPLIAQPMIVIGMMGVVTQTRCHHHAQATLTSFLANLQGATGIMVLAIVTHTTRLVPTILLR
jgi:hypothetical protein